MCVGLAILKSQCVNRLAPNDIYICRAVSPLNGRTAIKVDGGWGGDLSAARKITFRRQRVKGLQSLFTA